MNDCSLFHTVRALDVVMTLRPYGYLDWGMNVSPHTSEPSTNSWKKVEWGDPIAMRMLDGCDSTSVRLEIVDYPGCFLSMSTSNNHLRVTYRYNVNAYLTYECYYMLESSTYPGYFVIKNKYNGRIMRRFNLEPASTPDPGESSWSTDMLWKLSRRPFSVIPLLNISLSTNIF